MTRAFLLLLLVLPVPAAAQRPRCGYGEALAALRQAEAAMARPVIGLSEGRALAEEAGGPLRTAVETLRGCGCARAAQDASDAAQIAELAAQAPSAEALASGLRRAGFSLRLVRERLGGAGCS